MIENNQLDFGGIIAETFRLLQKKPAIRKLTSRIYPYICVDEFQDANSAQYHILRSIVNSSAKNLFVVADDDQIIYQWNGADPERLKSLRLDFGMSVLQLPENYRCPPAVIDVANKFIEHNLCHDSDKAFLAAHKQNDKSNAIRMKDFACFDEEAGWVARDIALRSKASRCKCVVLARTRRLLERIVEALEARNVPSYLAMRKDEFVSSPMAWLHAMLRLANARQDREQLRRVCKSFFNLEGINLIVGDVISDAAAEEGDYLRAWQRTALQREELEPKTKRFLLRSVPKLTDKLVFGPLLKTPLHGLKNCRKQGLHLTTKWRNIGERRIPGATSWAKSLVKMVENK